MATIQLKTGTGSAVPSSLTQGEVAINIDNGLVYYGSGSTNTTKQLESFTHITASGDISASGELSAATVSDVLAAAVVTQIDNDEIPIAKLAEDAVTVTAGTGLTGGGSITLGGSATVNVIGGTGVTANANDVAIGQDVATTANVLFNHITSSGNISSSGVVTGVRLAQGSTLINDTFAPITGHANIVTVGALNAGSITSGFTSIDVGSGAIKTTGILFGGNITGSNISASETITANAFVGDITGDLTGEADTVATIAGLAPNTATTQATQAAITTAANLTTVGALNAGSITSGFTSIDVGSGAIKTTGILSGGNITGSNISASLPSTSSFGRLEATTVKATNYYGYQITSHPSNATLNFNGSFFYVPLTGQSTGEHASSNSNERIPMTNPFNGHPIKTTIRSTNNSATKNAKFTCSIHFEVPFNNTDFSDVAPGTVAPGLASTGHQLFKEIHATGPNLNHAAVHFDWLQNAYSSSAITDIPSGSRITLSVKNDINSSVTYVINTVFAWDYSNLY